MYNKVITLQVYIIDTYIIYVIKQIRIEERLNYLPKFLCLFSGELGLEPRSPGGMLTCGTTHHSHRGAC